LDFPLLIKNLDCNDTLSVQVHPNDELAEERHNSFGKTEMWYIADAEEGAVIYLGFKNKNITREEYIQAVAEGTVADILQAVPVKKGDVFFIPAGTVHALAKGLNVIEIQQTSDITYRIFDWNRVDGEGKSRELHTALAVDAIDFESGVEECRRTYTATANKEVNIVDCEFFKTDMLVVDGVAELDYCQRDSFTIYMCIEGDVKISLDNETSETLRTGEVMLVPAIANEVVIEGKAQILASHL
jgi:mannose-6-phosphate isomerase